MTIDRRTFLKCSLCAPAAAVVPAVLMRAAFAAAPSDRVFVLLRLGGGNDGLNTVVPFEQDAYYNARPALGIGKGRIVELAGGVGLNPGLAPMRAAWEAGDLAVIQGVGYERPDRSHFVSTDIWHTASRDPQSRRTGWAGRALDAQAGTFGDRIPALHLGDEPLSLALVGETVVVPSVRDAERFTVRGGAKAAAVLERLAAGKPGSDILETIRGSAQRAYRTSERLSESLKGTRERAGYPQTPLGRRLWQIARLVEGGLGARIYAASLDGFDTHSRQAPVHDALMNTLGSALGAFYDDLKRNGMNDRVVLMTYSEFGRRVKENRSLGTDHGAAAPMFVMGGAAKGGLVGDHPSLTDLRDGDLKHHTDFRQAYATILERWFDVDARKILGAKYDPLPFL